MKELANVSIDETTRILVHEVDTGIENGALILALQVYEDGKWIDYGTGSAFALPKNEGVLRDLAAVFAREWDALVTERIAKAKEGQAGR